MGIAARSSDTVTFPLLSRLFDGNLFFESSGLWPATLALCTYILTVLHPALPSEHPHSLGLTVSSTHWTLLRIGSNVMVLAHTLVQRWQSVRGILGACGWLFVAQWHFLSSHEAWFSMTRIASQEHWGHKQTAHIITFSNHATCHRTSLKHHHKHHLHHFFSMFHINYIDRFMIFDSFMSVASSRPETQHKGTFERSPKPLSSFPGGDLDHGPDRNQGFHPNISGLGKVESSLN